MRRQFRAVCRAVVLVLLAAWPAGFLLQAAKPALKITAPADGTLVYSGRTFSIEVEADPSAFQAVGVVGQAPLGWTDGLSAPPYRFTLKTPPDFPSGVYKLTAMGVTRSGDQVQSQPVTIDVEQSDNPKQLLAELSTISFGQVGEESALVITGVFSDGTRVGLSHSTRTRYSSSARSVVVVRADGVAKAVGPGFAKITVMHGPLTLVIPVAVPSEKQP